MEPGGCTSTSGIAGLPPGPDGGFASAVGKHGGACHGLHLRAGWRRRADLSTSVLLFTLQAEGVWNPFHADLLSHAALLVGVGTRSTRTHVSLALGPPLTTGDLSTFRSAREHFGSELGLVVQARGLVLPLPSLGAGLTGFVNVNHRQSYGGLLLTLAFGRLR